MPLILPRDMRPACFHQSVPGKLDRAERNDPVMFVNRVVAGPCNHEEPEVGYPIPDGSSSLNVRVVPKGKMLTSSMTFGAPEDRTTAKARVNRLLRQLAKTRKNGIHIRAASAGNLSGFAPALVLTAQCDVLHDEGEAYARRLRAAGVEVKHRDCEGMIHGFFTMAPAIDGAVRAQALVCEAMKAAFESDA